LLQEVEVQQAQEAVFDLQAGLVWAKGNWSRVG
jgi:hypothetical protein